MQFFHDFFFVLVSLRSERNHHYLMALTRRPIDYGTMDNTLQLYSHLLTLYSFNYIREQFTKSEQPYHGCPRRPKKRLKWLQQKGTIPSQLRPRHVLAHRMGLPCRHMFRARTILQLPLFESSLDQGFLYDAEGLAISSRNRCGR